MRKRHRGTAAVSLLLPLVGLKQGLAQRCRLLFGEERRQDPMATALNFLRKRLLIAHTKPRGQVLSQ